MRTIALELLDFYFIVSLPYPLDSGTEVGSGHEESRDVVCSSGCLGWGNNMIGDVGYKIQRLSLSLGKSELHGLLEEMVL